MGATHELQTNKETISTGIKDSLFQSEQLLMARLKTKELFK